MGEGACSSGKGVAVWGKGPVGEGVVVWGEGPVGQGRG